MVLPRLELQVPLHAGARFQWQPSLLAPLSNQAMSLCTIGPVRPSLPLVEDNPHLARPMTPNSRPAAEKRSPFTART